MIDTHNLDLLIDQYLNEENVTNSKRASESYQETLDSEQYKYLRRQAKTDLFFLAYGVLGYNKLSENLHKHLCRWMLRNRAARFRMLLLPRGHYKSTIWTIADSIRIALPDDLGDQPWPENLGTNIRLMIGHETSDQASRFLVSIIGHFMSNPTLMALFPECVPNRSKHRINKSELELPRNEIWSEPTFDTMGVGAKSQGKHYNYLKLDDLIGDKARDSKLEMQAAKDWFDNIQSFFSEFTRDKLDLTGTRWAVDDLYSHVDEQYGPAILRYIRPAIENGEPIFPERFSLESFEVIKKNKKIWAAQYANNPEDFETQLNPAWLRFYQWHRPSGHMVVFSGNERRVIHPQECDIVILMDPAMTGRGGILVTATHENKDIFVLEAIKDDWNPHKVCDWLFKAVSKYRPRTVVIEEVLFSALFKHWFEAEMKLRGIRFHITLSKPGARAKDIRVLGLVNWFAAGKIYFHQDQLDLIDEYKKFGATSDYHMLDALAQGPEVWRVPFNKKQWDQNRQAETALLQARDIATGY